MSKADVVTMGEALIDFLPSGAGPLAFSGSPGGAPANVAVGARRLGASSAFIGKVGDDAFGRHLKAVLESEGVVTDGMVIDSYVNTTLAFVSLDEHGERSFTFYRKPGADSQLRPDELDLGLIDSCRALVHGSISLIGPPSSEATRTAVSRATGKNAAIVFDPNIRLALWPEPALARRVIIENLPRADMVKLSDDELSFLTGKNGREGALALAGYMKPGAVLILTLGQYGAYTLCPWLEAFSPGFNVNAVDTTGAGDAFLAAAVFSLLKLSGKASLVETVMALDAEGWKGVLDFANAAGAVTVSRKGAIPALPSEEEVLDMISSGKRASS